MLSYDTKNTNFVIQGELEHRRVKRFYSRTNKFKFTRQISKHERRERILHKIRSQKRKGKTVLRQGVQLVNRSNSTPPSHLNYVEPRPTAAVSFQESDPLPYTPPTAHHHISDSTRHYENIAAWLSTNQGDPALQVCIIFFIQTSQVLKLPRTSSPASKIIFYLGS